MVPNSLASAFRRRKRHLVSSLIPFLPLFMAHCNSTEAPPVVAPVTPIDTAVFKFIQPTAGKTYKLTDTVQIITESDFSKFASGVNLKYSMDSAKTWIRIYDLIRKSGIARDTVNWVPAEDAPDLTPGSTVIIRATDYNRKHLTDSPFIHFKN